MTRIPESGSCIVAPAAEEIGWLAWRSFIYLGEVALLAGVIAAVFFGAYVLGPVK